MCVCVYKHILSLLNLDFRLAGGNICGTSSLSIATPIKICYDTLDFYFIDLFFLEMVISR